MYRGKFAFKIDWASLILERKFTVFLCFTLYLRAVSKYKPPPPGGWGLVFGEAYTWRGLFLEFYGMTANTELTRNSNILLM